MQTIHSDAWDLFTLMSRDQMRSVIVRTILFVNVKVYTNLIQNYVHNRLGES